MIELDGRGIKVGDMLWNPMFGWGEVKNIESNASRPLMLTFKYGNFLFEKDGSYGDGPRSLFWDEVKIVPPKPKQKVKKWKWAYFILDSLRRYYHVTDLHYTEKEAYAKFSNIAGKIQETEIEEYE